MLSVLPFSRAVYFPVGSKCGIFPGSKASLFNIFKNISISNQCYLDLTNRTEKP